MSAVLNLVHVSPVHDAPFTENKRKQALVTKSGREMQKFEPENSQVCITVQILCKHMELQEW